MVHQANKFVVASAIVVSAILVIAADRYITEVPEDTSMIKVEQGTTTVAGAGLFRHMFVDMEFDPAKAKNFNSVTNGPILGMQSSSELKFVDDTERGDCIYTGNGGAFKMIAGSLDPRVPTDMSRPFTVAFWVKMTEECTKRSPRLFYLGPPSVAGAGESIDCYWGNDLERKNLRCCGSASTTYAFAETQVGKWLHLSLVCTPNTADGKACFNVGLYVNGTSVKNLNVFNYTNDASKISLWLGRSETSGADASCTYFDHFMMFDAALTEDEVSFVMEHSAPLDFSAGWEIPADGTLRIAGVNPLTALRGHGLCEKDDAMRLVTSSNDWFAGTISASGFTFAGGKGVKQGLLGTNVYAGATKVESGTLEIASTPMQIFGNALVAWYSFEDATNPGRDFSPRGNDLTPNDGFTYEALPAEGDLEGTGLMMSMTNCNVPSGMTSGSMLKGFDSGTDNSFTVAFWMRDDKGHYREGPYSFGKTSAFRRNGSDKVTYIGESSNFSYSETVWGEGVWHHWVVVYDADAAAKSENCYFLFKDGQFEASGVGDSTKKHATDVFYLGRSTVADESSIFEGALDEVIVLNSGDTNNVEKLYGFRRSHPASAGGTLPPGTDLTVDEGAVLKLTAANEVVARLFGKGTIDLSGNSKLTVTTKDRFEGVVIGGSITDEPEAERKGLVIVVR